MIGCSGYLEGGGEVKKNIQNIYKLKNSLLIYSEILICLLPYD